MNGAKKNVLIGFVFIVVTLFWFHSGDSAPASSKSSRNPSTAALPAVMTRARGRADRNVPNWTKDHTSLTRKYMTRELYEQLFPLSTRHGWTIDHIIQPAVDLPQAKGVHIGCVAGDEESYTVFSPFFNRIISEYHQVPGPISHTTDLDYSKLVMPQLSPDYIISTRIRVARSVAGIPFPPAANRGERRMVEQLVANACLRSLRRGGRYYSLIDLPQTEKQRLIDSHFLFEDPDAWTMSAGFGRDWPDGRGVFMDTEQKTIVWVNEEDHIRVISMQAGEDVLKVFTRLVDALRAIEQSLQDGSPARHFAHSSRLGYLTTCPTNLGTGLRASMHVRLPQLEKKMPELKRFASSIGLQVRGRGGEKDTAASGVVDVSNAHRLGYSEVQLVQTMLYGVKTLIDMERQLEIGRPVDLRPQAGPHRRRLR